MGLPVFPSKHYLYTSYSRILSWGTVCQLSIPDIVSTPHTIEYSLEVQFSIPDIVSTPHTREYSLEVQFSLPDIVSAPHTIEYSLEVQFASFPFHALSRHVT